MTDYKYQIDLLVALNERLSEQNNIYKKIAEDSGNLYIYTDFRNDSDIELIGPWDDLCNTRLVNRPFDMQYMQSLICDEDWDAFNEKIIKMQSRGEVSAVLDIRTTNKKMWFHCSATVYYDEEGNPKEKLISFINITRDKARNEELEYLAYFDSLTGLYNRNHFVTSLRTLCEKADSNNTTVELLFLDIDDFKNINDSLGLLLGDELVQSFGGRLQEYISDEVMIGRFGSDVFSVAIYDPCGNRSARAIYESVHKSLRTPFILTNKQEITFTVSAGVAEYPEAGRTAFELVKNAEIVLYKAKECGKNNIQYFEQEMLNSFIKSVSIEQRLKEAIENEDFELYFQPQFYAKTKKLRGAEALIRWIDENGKIAMHPTDFIPVAEKNGAIVPIGNWVIRDAMRIIREWSKNHKFPFVISINISAIQLQKDNFVDNVRNALNLYGINASLIELEITETVFLEDQNKAIQKINQLRKLGFKISLDDFGTGFSSLSYLKALPIDTLKIDKSFVDTAIEDKATNIITESVVGMVNKLGFETIAEGVEDDNQLEFLKKINCDVIQGFLLGKPMSRGEFEKLFESYITD